VVAGFSAVGPPISGFFFFFFYAVNFI